jgi:hypothetical protein
VVVLVKETELLVLTEELVVVVLKMALIREVILQDQELLVVQDRLAETVVTVGDLDMMVVVAVVVVAHIIQDQMECKVVAEPVVMV